jgi:SSS family solute:Na+ symporter
MVMAVFYWGTNQFIIQRALGAASLKEGQKGLLLAGFFKILIPFLAMAPGLIAFHLLGPDITPGDMAYPALVAETLPAPLLGLFVAVLLGAVFSTYNSLLNSSATMFAIDIYKPLINKTADDHKLISIAKIFAIAAAVFTIAGAPNLINAPEGIFIFIAKFFGFVAIPIACLIIMGLFAKNLRIPHRAAQFIILFHLLTYYTLVWGLEKMGITIPMHWMHTFSILFLAETGIIVLWSLKWPHHEAFTHRHSPKVEMVPWRFSMLISAVLLSLATMTYVLFSNVGVAYAHAVVAPSFWIWFIVSFLACTAFCLWAHTCLQRKYERFISNRYGLSSETSVSLN